MRLFQHALVFITSLFCYSLIGAAEIPIVLDGHKAQGGFLIGQTGQDVTVTYQNNTIEKTPTGFFFIGFGRDEAASQSITLTNSAGETQVIPIELETREYKIQRINGLPKKKVTPDPEHLARIRKESALAKKARKHSFKTEYFLEEFQWPVLGPITGVYGSQRVLNGEPRRPHFGVDIAAPVGTPVYAPAGGEVTLVHDDMYFSGGTLIIDHGYGVSSTFIHLNKVIAKHGQKVKQGDLIAEVGKTGRVTGAHLDWRMNWYTTRIDPVFFVGDMPETE